MTDSETGRHSLREPEDVDIEKSVDLGFEVAKQITTLSAGALVLLATFLKDIFTNKNGVLVLTGIETGLVGTAFAALGLALLLAVVGMWAFAIMRRMRRPFEGQKARFAVYAAALTLCFLTGIGTFVVAVLSNLL